MKAKLTNPITGEVVVVTATTEHPDSSYGKAVWVDAKNQAYCQVDFPSLYSVELILDDIPHYLYNGAQVVLLDPNDVPNITPASTSGKYNPYYLNAKLVEAIEDGTIKAHLTYDDCYSGWVGATEIVHTDVVNVENEQRLLSEWVTIPYANTDEAERELCVTTDGYYDWESERSRMIDRIRDGEDIEELRKEWEDIVRTYYTRDVDRDYSFDSLLREID